MKYLIVLFIATLFYYPCNGQKNQDPIEVIKDTVVPHITKDIPNIFPRYQLGIGCGTYSDRLYFLAYNLYGVYRFNPKFWVDAYYFNSIIQIWTSFLHPPDIPFEQSELGGMAHWVFLNTITSKRKKFKYSINIDDNPIALKTELFHKVFRQLSLDGGFSILSVPETPNFTYRGVDLQWNNNKFYNLNAGLRFSWGKNYVIKKGDRLNMRGRSSSLYAHISYAPYISSQLSQTSGHMQPGIELSPEYKRVGFRIGYRTEWRLGNSPFSIYALGEVITRARHNLVEGAATDYGSILRAHFGLLVNSLESRR